MDWVESGLTLVGRSEKAKQVSKDALNFSDESLISIVYQRFTNGMWTFTLVGFGAAWRSFHAYRLIQFRTCASNDTQFGSTRVKVDHSIAAISDPPSSSNVIVAPIETVTIPALISHINVSSPILFVLPRAPVNTADLEYFLLNQAHNVPIYFTTDLSGYPHGFAKLRSIQVAPNILHVKSSLQNVIGVINSSKSAIHQRIILITVPLDTFSAAPTLGVGSNSSGIAIAAFLETIRVISKFPLVNDYVFCFAITDGRFCGFEGLARLLHSFNSDYKNCIEFAISLDSIFSKKIQARFSKPVQRNSTLFQFVRCLVESLKVVGIDFQAEIREFANQLFVAEGIESISISGEIITSVTDVKPDILRADSFTWALSEALLRTMYNSAYDSIMIDKMRVDSSIWARSIGRIPRVAPFRDPALVQMLAEWMRHFSVVKIDEWVSGQCFTPYSSTEAVLVLYNPAPMAVYVLLYLAALIYGLLVFMALARHKVFRLRSL
jgi:hypothetical protein